MSRGARAGEGEGQFANIFACNATILLNDTIISDAGNYEGSGGGLFGSNIKLRAYNTSWLDNQAKHGGAIATVSSDVGIYDSNFAGNYAGTGAEGSGGAVSFRGVGAPDFCVYYGPGNFSANHGDRRNVTMVRNTVFAGNANLGVVGGGGGAAYLDVATNQDGAPVFDGCTFTGNSCTGIYIAPWGFSMGGAVSVGSLGCAVDKGQWFRWENCTCGGNMPWDFADSVSECGLQPGDPNNTWPVGFVCKTPPSRTGSLATTTRRAQARARTGATNSDGLGPAPVLSPTPTTCIVHHSHQYYHHITCVHHQSTICLLSQAIYYLTVPVPAHGRGRAHGRAKVAAIGFMFA